MEYKTSFDQQGWVRLEIGVPIVSFPGGYDIDLPGFIVKLQNCENGTVYFYAAALKNATASNLKKNPTKGPGFVVEAEGLEPLSEAALALKAVPARLPKGASHLGEFFRNFVLLDFSNPRPLFKSLNINIFLEEVLREGEFLKFQYSGSPKVSICYFFIRFRAFSGRNRSKS